MRTRANTAQHESRPPCRLHERKSVDLWPRLTCSARSLIPRSIFWLITKLYRITAVHFSVGLTALTVFDAALVWLTWREYQAKRARRHRAEIPAASSPPGGRGTAGPQPGPRP